MAAVFSAEGVERIADAGAVLALRPTIRQSWARSVQCGLHPGSVEPAYSDSIRRRSLLVSAVRDVMGKHHHVVEGTSSTVQLTDRNGWILERWDSDSETRREMERSHVEAGFLFDEASVGTNSAGLVIETGEAHVVAGSEHFADQFTESVCYGVPIYHPDRQLLVGSLNLTCRVRDRNDFQMPWLRAVVGEIDQRMLESIQGDERRLLDEFKRESGFPRRKVIAISSDTMITNASAADRLTRDDHDRLRQFARSVDVPHTSKRISLSHGEQAVRARMILAGDHRIGVILSIDERYDERQLRLDSPAADTLSPPRPAQTLYIGEQHTGKATLARAAVEDAKHIVEVDARQDAPTRAELRSLLETADTNDDSAVVILGIDRLGPDQLAYLRSYIGRVDRSRQLVFTAEDYGDLSETTDSGKVVVVPPLRERRPELPDLIRQVSTAVVGSPSHAPDWSADAIDTIAHLPLYGNFDSLKTIVTHAITHSRGGLIKRNDLPIDIRNRAVGKRALSPLEAAEARTIATVMRDVSGNKVAAADRLGIARSTLYRRLRELGLDIDTRLL